MYDRYTCPLQPCTHLTLKLLIQGNPHAEVTHIVDFKSAYISLIIDPRGLQCETYRKSCAANLLMLSDFTLTNNTISLFSQDIHVVGCFCSAVYFIIDHSLFC